MLYIFKDRRDEDISFSTEASPTNEPEWLRLHYVPNSYGYGVMWARLNFNGTPAVTLPDGLGITEAE